MTYEFYKVWEAAPVAYFLANYFNKLAPSKQSVLILLSGGSAVELAVQMRAKLDVRLSSYCFSLVDERYGPVGHGDSNWAQLQEAGFDFGGASNFPVLADKSLQQTTADFNQFLSGASSKFDYVAGLFGMGADGHTSGILPHSPAVDSSDYVTSYDGPDYHRITTTPMFIKTIDEAFLFALGDNKRQQIDNLKKDLPIAQQPAQILKAVSKLIVFNDYEGGVL